MHIRGEMTSGKLTLSMDLKWFFGPYACIFEGGPPPFSESTCPYGKVAENGPLAAIGTGWGAKLNQVSLVPAGVLRVISGGFLTPTRAFSKGAPHLFRKHMPWAKHMPSGMGRGTWMVISSGYLLRGPYSVHFRIRSIPYLFQKDPEL